MKAYKELLLRAENDLKSAIVLKDNQLYDSAVYHCQQSAEKALKAFLIYKNKELVKTHDLDKLNTLCEGIDPDFESIYDLCELLTPFATQFRYFGADSFMPDKVDVLEAIESAQKIFNMISNKMRQ